MCSKWILSYNKVDDDDDYDDDDDDDDDDDVTNDKQSWALLQQIN